MRALNYVQRERGVEWTRERRPWAVATARSRRWTIWERVSRTWVSSSSFSSREEKIEESRRDCGGADMVAVVVVILGCSYWAVVRCERRIFFFF